ncbi:MAG: hypothetical protein GY805_03750, partial [Chloroflexi bacterium]|nr:hypothetical protein [Chloroflexota bacterium]
LALATKYQAILFLPLLLGLGWLVGWRGKLWLRGFVGILLPLLALFAWEWARTGSFSLWQNQINNFGGVRLSWSWELWPRFLAWGELWQTAVSPLIFIILIPTFGWLFFQHIRLQTSPSVSLRCCGKKNIDRLLLIFIFGYGISHWLLAIPVWDRYLLPLLPLLALLLARIYGSLLAYLPSNPLMLKFRGAVVILTLLLISASWSARNGRYQLGSFPQADHGAAAIATVLSDAPYGTVLYDHWFSWQWRYHLFDKRVFVSWFPHGQALTADLAAFGHDGSPRYLALPNAAVSQPIIRIVGQAGFTLTAVSRSNDIILYQIHPQILQINKKNLRNLWTVSSWWQNEAV